jgi:hypothetical protein
MWWVGATRGRKEVKKNDCNAEPAVTSDGKWGIPSVFRVGIWLESGEISQSSQLIGRWKPVKKFPRGTNFLHLHAKI